MYFHIEYWSSNDNEVTGYSSWKDKEQDVQVKLGVIKEASAFEVVAITANSVTLRKADGQQSSYGTFGPGPSSRTQSEIVRSKEEILPWDFIDTGVTKEFLRREWENAMNESVTPNCRMRCSGCGVKKFGGGVCYEDKN